MAITVTQLAEHVGAKLQGSGDGEIRSLGNLATAESHQLTFLTNPKYRKYLKDSQAGAVLCTEEDAKECAVPALIVANPHYAFAQLSLLFDPAPKANGVISERAAIAEDAQIGEGVSIAPGAVIESGAVISDGCTIMANAVIGAHVQLAKNVTIYPNAVVYHSVEIGEDSVVHAGAVIGADGFGFAFGEGRWHSVAQVGTVKIGRGVVIGANSTIDRGAIDDTIIGDGVIIDDQVHLGHNVNVGDHSAFAGKAGISGSTRIGKYCMIGGAVGMAGHIEIADQVILMGMTMVTKSIKESGVYGSGIPVEGEKRWRRNVARFRRLDGLYRRVQELEKKLK